MLEDIKSNITRLIAMYESERQRADALEARLLQSETLAGEYKTQIDELNTRIDNLKLSGAFSGNVDPSSAKARLDQLVHDIEMCIKLLDR